MWYEKSKLLEKKLKDFENGIEVPDKRNSSISNSILNSSLNASN